MTWMAESRVIRQQTRQLLRGLGDNAEEVANSLAAEGVHGKPRSPQGCALAVYVTAVVGADNRISSVVVNDTHLSIRPASRWSPPIVVRLPRTLREFISIFDAGRFPRLLQSPPSRPPVPTRRTG
jgi:hypothetical protein